MSTDTLLIAKALARTYDTEAQPLVALQDLDLEVTQGESLAIVGRSGSGKSTLLRLLGALDRHYSGSLRFRGSELRGLSDGELSRFRNEQVGFVFQSINLLAGLSVGENVMMPAFFGSRLGAVEAQARARSLLQRVGLGGTWSKRPLTLSGGERQRVAIARALLMSPTLLLCDEPTANLDAATARDVLDMFAELADERATTLVIATHDPMVAQRADRVLELDSGRVRPDASSSLAIDSGALT